MTNKMRCVAEMTSVHHFQSWPVTGSGPDRDYNSWPGLLFTYMCVCLTNTCQCQVSRTDVCHSQDRVLGTYWFFFLLFLLDAKDSEAVKAEPKDRRIWVILESQIKENHPPTRSSSIELLRECLINLKCVKITEIWELMFTNFIINLTNTICLMS